MNDGFNIASTPQLYFGPGKISNLPLIIKSFGSNILLVTGSHSFISSPHHQILLDGFLSNHISFSHYIIPCEPTAQLIDDAVRKYSSHNIKCVVAIGGGSVLDAGKAISAMLLLNEPVKDYLEGVGTKPNHPGVKIPFIAVPTTSGTGSEATKNAVISEIGPSGYKKSLRHNQFVPNVAVVDPILTISCSLETTAASGMDAFTQLLESYLSTAANPITDALAYEGLQHITQNLQNSYNNGANIEARTGMALASYLSGITLANAGLGVVHGFAGVIGGFFSIAHGVICSSLMAAANRVTVRQLRFNPNGNQALVKYARVGKLFSGQPNKSDDYYIDALLETIERFAIDLKIPKLRACGVTPGDFDKIVKASDNKNNPVALSKEEMLEVLNLAM
jgi:alcohol dehydrogenase class IV